MAKEQKQRVLKPGRPTGVIKLWVQEKGYGCIQQDDGRKDLYCSRKHVWLDEGHWNPKVGSRVEFDYQCNSKGGRAHNVCAIGGGNCEGGRHKGIVKEWDPVNGKGQIQTKDGSLLPVA